MFNIEAAQNFTKEQAEAVASTSAVFSKGLQEITQGTGEYTKTSVEAAQAFLAQLREVKSVDKAFELQTDFAKQSFESFIAHSTKMGELFTSLVTNSLKPTQDTFRRAQATMTPTATSASAPQA